MRPDARTKFLQVDGKRASKDINGKFYSKCRDLYSSVPSDVNEVETLVKRNINSIVPDDFKVDGEFTNQPRQSQCCSPIRMMVTKVYCLLQPYMLQWHGGSYLVNSYHV